MTKKAIIILSIIAILLLAGGFWFFSREEAVPGEEEGIISRLFPFAGEREIEGLPGLGEGEFSGGTEGRGGEAEETILTQLTQSAISGATFSKTTGTTTIRYVERSTGHIYEIEAGGKNRKRLSNTTILKTFESQWSPKADNLVLRYFEDSGVKTFLASIVQTEENEVSTEGVFLPNSVTAVAVSPIEDKIFYLNPFGEITKGITADFENKKQNNIFSLPFGEFNIHWPSKNTIILLTKPSVNEPGFLYSLGATSGLFKKMLGGINGLTALVSPSLEQVIYSQSQNNTIETKMLNFDEDSSISFGLRTFPEKCVWSNINEGVVYCSVPSKFSSAEYPDAWHQGLVSFSDSIWKVDFSTGKTEFLNDVKLDVINLSLSIEENYLIFTNKINNTLWSLKLE